MKRLARSIVYGLLTQAFALYLVFMTHSEAAASWLLWNGSLAELIAGPMPVVGHTPDGRAVSEPTTIHVVMAVAGLAFGVAAYSALIYFALKAWGARRSHKATNSESGKVI